MLGLYTLGRHAWAFFTHLSQRYPALQGVLDLRLVTYQLFIITTKLKKGDLQHGFKVLTVKPLQSHDSTLGTSKHSHIAGHLQYHVTTGNNVSA